MSCRLHPPTRWRESFEIHDAGSLPLNSFVGWIFFGRSCHSWSFVVVVVQDVAWSFWSFLLPINGDSIASSLCAEFLKALHYSDRHHLLDMLLSARHDVLRSQRPSLPGNMMRKLMPPWLSSHWLFASWMVHKATDPCAPVNLFLKIKLLYPGDLLVLAGFSATR